MKKHRRAFIRQEVWASTWMAGCACGWRHGGLSSRRKAKRAWREHRRSAKIIQDR